MGSDRHLAALLSKIHTPAIFDFYLCPPSCPLRLDEAASPDWRNR